MQISARRLANVATFGLGCLVLVIGFVGSVAGGPVPSGQLSVSTFQAVRKFTGHQDGVWSVSFSPDGRQALSGSYDRTARLWDVGSGTELLKMADFPAAVLATAILPDGKSCVVCCSDGVVHCCDLKSGKKLRQFTAHKGSVNALSITLDGKTMATGGADGLVKIWDVATGTEKRILAGSNDWLWSVAISPDGKQVLAGGADKLARIWDIQSGKELLQLTGHKDSVNSVAFSPDGKQALTGCNDGDVRLWTLDKGQLLRQMSGQRTPVYSVMFSREGRHAFSAGADGLIHSWELAGQDNQSRGMSTRIRNRPSMVMDPYGNPVNAELVKEARRYEGHDDAIYRLALSPDGKFMLSSGRDGTVRLWETGSIDAELHDFVHPGLVPVATFTNNGARVATLSTGVIRGWNVDQGTLYRQQPLVNRVYQNRYQDLQAQSDQAASQPFLHQARVLPPGNQIAALTPAGMLVVWNGDSQLVPRTLELAQGKGQFHSAVFTKDNKEVVTGAADGRVVAWDMQTGKQVRSVKFAGSIVSNLAIASNDRDLLAVCVSATGQGKNADQVIRRLIRADLKETDSYPIRKGQVTGLTIAPDNASFLASNSDGTVTWSELKPKGSTKLFTIPGGRVTTVTFLNNEQFATAAGDHVIRVWNLADGKELQRLDGHQATITGLAYSVEKKILLSASDDHSVRVWRIGAGSTIPQATTAKAETRVKPVAGPK